ncbi:MAG: YdeI/OmpD-associated family protein [Caldilineaceae bacterium]
MEQRFQAEIQKLGSRVVLPIPLDPNTIWGEKARHDVYGTINTARIRGPLVIEKDHYYLALGPAWRRDNEIEAGMTVTVTLEAEGPQIAAMAEDLMAAFAAAPAALAFYNALPTFYRKNYLRWVTSAKRPETRAKRIGEMIELLAAEKRER